MTSLWPFVFEALLISNFFVKWTIDHPLQIATLHQLLLPQRSKSCCRCSIRGLTLNALHAHVFPRMRLCNGSVDFPESVSAVSVKKSRRNHLRPLGVCAPRSLHRSSAWPDVWQALRQCNVGTSYMIQPRALLITCQSCVP